MSYTAIVDYGVGNLFSLASSLRHLGLESRVTRDPACISEAARIILPGVGAFGDAMDKLCATGLVPILDAQVKAGKPFLGICLGMELLFERGYEYGLHKGLAYLPGSICAMAEDLQDQKIPHMGWNALRIRKSSPLLQYVSDGDYVYFVHSFYAKGCEGVVIADVDYGIRVPAVVGHDNVLGCQFHPEKSGKAGLSILRAFGEMA